jgi:folate-dependent phosphoribosylglycinamide formyltransferase PurN
MENEARETGAMMHLVTPVLDKGPVVTYCTFPIRGEPFDKYWEEIKRKPLAQLKQEQGEDNALFKLIRQHGVARELPLIISTIQAFSQGKVKITADKRVIDAEGKPIHGYNLTEEINEAVKGVLS